MFIIVRSVDLITASRRTRTMSSSLSSSFSSSSSSKSCLASLNRRNRRLRQWSQNPSSNTKQSIRFISPAVVNVDKLLLLLLLLLVVLVHSVAHSWKLSHLPWSQSITLCSPSLYYVLPINDLSSRFLSFSNPKREDQRAQVRAVHKQVIAAPAPLRAPFNSLSSILFNIVVGATDAW